MTLTAAAWLGFSNARRASARACARVFRVVFAISPPSFRCLPASILPARVIEWTRCQAPCPPRAAALRSTICCTVRLGALTPAANAAPAKEHNKRVRRIIDSSLVNDQTVDVHIARDHGHAAAGLHQLARIAKNHEIGPVNFGGRSGAQLPDVLHGRHR